MAVGGALAGAAHQLEQALVEACRLACVEPAT